MDRVAVARADRAHVDRRPVVQNDVGFAVRRIPGGGRAVGHASSLSCKGAHADPWPLRIAERATRKRRAGSPSRMRAAIIGHLGSPSRVCSRVSASGITSNASGSMRSTTTGSATGPHRRRRRAAPPPQAAPEPRPSGRCRQLGVVQMRRQVSGGDLRRSRIAGDFDELRLGGLPAGQVASDLPRRGPGQQDAVDLGVERRRS